MEGSAPVDVFGQVVFRSGGFQPVLKFTLVDDEARTFEVCRMTYRGDGGWSRALATGKLRELVKKTVPHLGKDTFFELY